MSLFERELWEEEYLEDVGEGEGDLLTDFYVDDEADYSVIGPTDGRFPITARARRPSSLQFPFNTICFLEEIVGGRARHLGTGTLIAPQIVLTAKHVLMRNVSPPCRPSRQLGTFRRRIRVTPGADLSASSRRKQRPASPSSQIANRTRFRVHPTLDYGVIILPRPFRRPNHFMILQPRSDRGTATLLTIAGYPCDKPRGTMWGHSDRIPVTGVTRTNLFYTIDTCPGHSGSPIWLLGNDQIRILLGVHTAGPNGCANDPKGRCRPTGAVVTPSGGRNCGVRITCDVIDTIERWAKAARVKGPRVDRRTYRRRCPRK